MKNLSLVWALLALCLGSVGCLAGGVPTVYEVAPPAGQTGVDDTIQSVSVMYSADLDLSSVQPDSIQIVEKGGSTPIAGITSFDSQYPTLTFKLDAAASLQPNTTYEVTVSANLKAADGEAFDSAYSWSFTTGATK